MKINFKVIRNQTAKQAGSAIEKRADEQLNKKYLKAREIFFKELLEDDISKELMAGNEAPNYSKTMSREGNLFSFFGFEEGSEPVKKLIEYLEERIYQTPSKIVRGRKNITVRGGVEYPSLETIEDADIGEITGDYESRGWIYGVRRGHPNYGRYIFEIIEELRSDASRSGTGLQLKGTVQGGSFYPRNTYISQQIQNFRRNLNK